MNDDDPTFADSLMAALFIVFVLLAASGVLE